MEPRPVIVREAGREAAGWEPAAGAAPVVDLGAATREEARTALAAAGCALVDGTGPDPAGVARRVHSIDPALQVAIVAPAEERARIERAVPFAPGTGAVWVIPPGEVGAEMLRRASAATERRRALRASGREPISDAFLAALLAVLPDPVLSLDDRGRILSWNAAAERAFGRTREEAVGVPMAEVLGPETAESLARVVGVGGGTQEVRVPGKDGAWGVAEVAVVPVEIAGSPVRMVILHDVTEERRGQADREAQAAELEMQAEELHSQASQLEEAQVELEMANDELLRANHSLTERTEDAEAARAAAQVSRARLEAVLLHMPSGVLVAEAPGGRLILGNEQVERILRCTLDLPAELDEVGDFEAFHPDGRPYRLEEWPLTRSLLGARVLDEEIHVARGDGSRGIVSMSSAPIEDDGGRIVAAVAILDDVTEQKEWEDEQAFLLEAGRLLASSLEYEETLRSVARLAVPRIADWCAVDVLEDERVRRLEVAHSDPGKEELAREIERRWPTDPDSPTGVPHVLRTGERELLSDISPELVRAAARDDEHLRVLEELGLRSAMIVPMLARGRTLGAVSLVAAESGRRFDEHDLALAEQLASRAAVAVDNARLYQEAKLARDEAEHARREAEAANRAKSDFLATMSHEIRTPINAIVGYTDLLAMGLSGPVNEAQMAQLERVRASSNHLLLLIEDVLDLAKVESGRMQTARERALVADAVASALSLLGPQPDDHRVEIHPPAADASATSYVGDEDRVRQILVNLLSNAVKFTEAGGEVRIECGTASGPVPGSALPDEGPWTYIRVTDTGIGIAPEDVERVFLPFQQAEAVHTRTRGGTGLGLAISRRLARLMGGDLTVASEPGVGSAFTLWLPQELAAAPLPEALRAGERSGPRPRGTALAGEAVRSELGPILATFVRRLAEDPQFATGGDVDQAKLEDHTAALLADVAQSLIVLEDSDGTDLLYDSSEIQRVVSELHGAQRARLGWTEASLRREFEVLREEIEAAVRRKAPSAARDGNALEVLPHILEHAERLSLKGLRQALARISG